MKLSFISINKQADNNVGIRCEAEIIEKHMGEHCIHILRAMKGEEIK